MSEFHVSEIPTIVEYLNSIIERISEDYSFVSYTNISMYAPGYIVMGRIFLKHVELNKNRIIIPTNFTNFHLYAVKNINDRPPYDNPFNFYVDFTNDKSVKRSIINFFAFLEAINPLKKLGSNWLPGSDKVS